MSDLMASVVAGAVGVYAIMGLLQTARPLVESGSHIHKRIQAKYPALFRLLMDADQSHLFEGWGEATDSDIDRFFKQVGNLDKNYPGGLKAYIAQARRLLKESKEGANPFKGLTPEVPCGSTLEFDSKEYNEMEQKGLEAADGLAFVLVAGGLGERLGYGGIKVALPSEIETMTMFLQLYVNSILAVQRVVQERLGKTVKLPLVIMTSDDTHNRTLELLEGNDYFGMDQDQLTLLKQEKVASINDDEGHLARDPNDPYNLLTKPHGHGDVHYLLYSSGIAQRWKAEGRKWVFFFQDTNGLVFRPLLSALGVSATRNFAANSLTGSRKAKQAMGAICCLRRADGSSFTTNVEYNILEPLLLASGFSDGDVNGPDGFSPYPGNMNQLIFRLDTYFDTLQATKGMITEFVNPKYADETRTKFKSPTRLECMMQDLPKMFGPEALVGFTTIVGNGLPPTVPNPELQGQSFKTAVAQEELAKTIRFYTPVKNNIRDASKKQRNGIHPACAASGEADIYGANCRMLLAIGVKVAAPRWQTWGSADQGTAITVADWPHVVLSSQSSMSMAALHRTFPNPAAVSIAHGSSLILSGGGSVVINSLSLKGALQLHAGEGVVLQVTLDNVENDGRLFESICEPADEALQVRGYRLKELETSVISRESPPGLFTYPL